MRRSRHEIRALEDKARGVDVLKSRGGGGKSDLCAQPAQPNGHTIVFAAPGNEYLLIASLAAWKIHWRKPGIQHRRLSEWAESFPSARRGICGAWRNKTGGQRSPRRLFKCLPHHLHNLRFGYKKGEAPLYKQRRRGIYGVSRSPDRIQSDERHAKDNR
jgi:hypothetical protein